MEEGNCTTLVQTNFPGPPQAENAYGERDISEYPLFFTALWQVNSNYKPAMLHSVLGTLVSVVMKMIPMQTVS